MREEGAELMESSNPVLSKAFGSKSKRGYAAFESSTPVAASPDQLDALYQAPAASSARTGRMTMDDVVTRTGILFTVLVVVGAAAWTLKLGGAFLMIGLIGGFILAMVNSFSSKVRPGAVIAYAGFQGIALGSLSRVYETIYPGIVGQAILGTICAFTGVLLAYRSGRIRVTPRFQRIVMGAMVWYLLLGLVAIFVPGLRGGGTGLLIAAAGVALASFFLVLDFDQIAQGVKAGVPEQESWRAAFGLMVTVVWMYLEILRLLSILRSNNN